VQDGERFWCLGVDGAARLVITPEMDGFLMYRADQDKSWVIPGLSPWWSGSKRTRRSMRGPTALQVEFREALERARRQRGAGGG
jgi:hypothetical protein